MHNLKFQLKQMCHRMNSGSFSTRATKWHLFCVIADTAVRTGYGNLGVQGLKPKHVEAFLDFWRHEEYSVGHIKNLMTSMRQWSEYIGKENVVRRSNRDYGIDDRMYVTNVSKAKILDSENWARLTDEYTKTSIRLIIEYGLRREEAIKLQPDWADLSDKLRLKDSWTKGGKYREIEIATASQRAVLDAAKVVANGMSLIPPNMRYIDQLNRFKAQCQKSGIGGVHGFRHYYAQLRYESLAGWKCPTQGGPTSKELTPEQKVRDRQVRLQISRELGHEREQVTAIYLGR